MFFDGFWYRGPIFYRWTHGRRMFWLNGGWREDSRRGPLPAGIAWENRSGPLRGFRPGVDFRRAPHPRGGPWPGSHGGPGFHGNFGGGPGHH